MTIYLLIDELHDQIKFLIKCTDEYVSIWKQQLFNQKKKKMHLKKHTVDVEVKHVNKNISISHIMWNLLMKYRLILVRKKYNQK